MDPLQRLTVYWGRALLRPRVGFLAHENVSRDLDSGTLESRKQPIGTLVAGRQSSLVNMSMNPPTYEEVEQEDLQSPTSEEQKEVVIDLSDSAPVDNDTISVR